MHASTDFLRHIDTNAWLKLGDSGDKPFIDESGTAKQAFTYNHTRKKDIFLHNAWLNDMFKRVQYGLMFRNVSYGYVTVLNAGITKRFVVSLLNAELAANVLFFG